MRVLARLDFVQKVLLHLMCYLALSPHRSMQELPVEIGLRFRRPDSTIKL